MTRVWFTRAAIAPIALVLGACVVVPLSSTASNTTAPAAARVTEAQRDSAAREIAVMMQASAMAWNRGDLDAFVNYYEPDTTTTYIGRNEVVRGRAAIRARYAPRFEPGAQHDSLSFDGTEVDLLAPGVANVISWYRLTRGDSVTGRGPTSLVMRRDADGQWRIVHDHSS
jgi:uncharacterized protein (TIGR02246 family)